MICGDISVVWSNKSSLYIYMRLLFQFVNYGQIKIKQILKKYYEFAFGMYDLWRYTGVWSNKISLYFVM